MQAGWSPVGSERFSSHNFCSTRSLHRSTVAAFCVTAPAPIGFMSLVNHRRKGRSPSIRGWNRHHRWPWVDAGAMFPKVPGRSVSRVT